MELELQLQYVLYRLVDPGLAEYSLRQCLLEGSGNLSYHAGVGSSCDHIGSSLYGKDRGLRQ